MTDQKLIDEGYADGKKSFGWHIKQISEQFDFVKVHKAMVAIEWHWKMGEDKNGNEKMGIPSLQTIKNFAHDLLKQSYDEETTLSTGGFMAGWDDGEMYLIFIIEEASA